MRKGALEYCVLALLEPEATYGFEIVRKLAEVDGLLTSEGTIYPLLARLKKEALVETEWHESRQGPPRKYYRLSVQGRKALGDFRQQWTRFRDAVDFIIGPGDGS